MITNLKQSTQIGFSIRRATLLFLGLITAVLGMGQNDTVQVCPQSEFFVLEDSSSYLYLDPEDSDFLIDSASSQSEIYFYLTPSWATDGMDSIWQVAFSFSGSIYIEMASIDSCNADPELEPFFQLGVDCDSVQISFDGAIPVDTIVWDEARLMSCPTIGVYQDLATNEDSLSSNFLGILPDGSALADAIFCAQWSDVINGAQLNIVSTPDTLEYPEQLILGDTIYACRGSADSIANFNLFELEYLEDLYATVSIFDSPDMMGGVISPGSGFSAMDRDTLYVLLEYLGPNCPSDTALIDLIINEFPAFTALEDLEICAGDTVPLEIVNGELPWTIIFNGDSILVMDDVIIFEPIIESDTITNMVITDALGCSNIIEFQDTLFLHPIPEFILLDDSICVSDQIEIIFTGGPLTMFVSDSDSLNFDDILNDSMIVSVAPPQGVSIEILEIGNQYCSNTNSYSILVDDLPTYSMLDTAICGSEGMALLTTDVLYEFLDLDDDVSGTWSYIDAMALANDSVFDIPIELILQLENLTGCLSQDTIMIYPFESPEINLWDDTLSFCQGDTLDLTLVMPAVEVSYFDSIETQWTVHDAAGDLISETLVFFDPEIGLSILSGEWISPLQLTVWTDPPQLTCDQVIDSSYFNLDPLPEYSLISGACAGADMFLDFESFNNLETVTYTWPGMSPATISAGSPIPTVATEIGPTAVLDLLLTSDLGCTVHTQETVQIFPSPAISSVTIGNSQELTVCENDSDIPIDASPSSYSAYFWDISGSSITSTDEDLDAQFLVDTISNAQDETLTLIVHDSISFMNTDFVCISEEYEFPIDVAGVRCEIEEIYQFPGGLFVLEVANVDPDELNFVEWTIEGQDPVLGGAFIYLPGILDAPEAQLEVTTSAYGPSICACQKSVETFGLVADLVKSISSFPNPVTDDEVNILLPDVFLEKSADFNLYTASADLVFSARRTIDQPLIRIDIPTELKGMLILEVVTSDFSMRSKLIIE